MPFDCDLSAAARNATLGPLGIDYLHIHYCVFGSVAPVSYVLLAAWLGLLFFFLGTTADGYFSPTLASISEKLNIPYDVAGVTLLAFGNGAPDVFSAIAAYSSGVGEAGINELLGAAVFVSNVVVGCVAIVSAVDVQRWAFSRDVLALLASLVLVLIVYKASPAGGHSTGKSSVLQLAFLIGYLVYVGSVVLPVLLRRCRRARHRKPHTGADEPTSNSMLSAFWLALTPAGERDQRDHAEQPATPTSAFVSMEQASPSSVERTAVASSPKQVAVFVGNVVENHFQDASSESSSPTTVTISDEERAWASGDEDGSQADAPPVRVQFSNGARILESAYWRHLRWRWKLQRRIVQLRGGPESLLVKVLSVPNIALVLIRDVTVPLLDQDAWSRSLAALSWVTVPSLLLWASGLAGTEIGPYATPLWPIVATAGCVAALVVGHTTYRSRPPESLAYCSHFLLIAFAACVCWMYVAANELVALLVALGTITHVSNSLLGLTVLAWGNSVGDLITDVSVARAGFPEMAIAGCYGGPVFNILLGLGIPMMLAFFRGDTQHMGFDVHAWVSMGFLLFSLAASYAVVRRNGFTCPPWFGKTLVAYYAVYTVVNLVIALKK